MYPPHPHHSTNKKHSDIPTRKQQGFVATTGFFDGVHLGHCAVLQRVKKLARFHNSGSIVITFWPHPQITLQQKNNKIHLLNTLNEKQQRIQALGIDHIYVIPFTKHLAALPPETFMREYLRDRFHISTLVIGYDHHLGKNATAGYEQLHTIGQHIGIIVDKVPPVYITHNNHTQTISSSRIRLALTQGDITTANRFLNYPYTLQGAVIEGQHIGRQIEFPTANIHLYEPQKQRPANGVYATRVQHNHTLYRGMTNIGVRPTVQPTGAEQTIETHILNFKGDIYGETITLEFIARIRDEQQFSSIYELATQLKIDKALCESTIHL
jgi:riboflavin kinase/FMN adenylyltransferase